MATLTKIKKYKNQYCKGVKGSYAKMRSACKEYVDNKAKKAKKGTKTATRTEARKEALAIVNGSCPI